MRKSNADQTVEGITIIWFNISKGAPSLNKGVKNLIFYKQLRRNPPDVGVKSGQKSCTNIIYIVLQTSVGLF